MVAAEKIIEAQKQSRVLYLAYCSFIMCCQNMSLGMGLGYAGLVAPEHRQNQTNMVTLTEDEITWFLGFTPLSMFVGVLVSIWASEMLGRKRLLMVSNIISICGLIIIYFALSFILLALGRIIQSFGMGLGAMAIGVYLSEITTVNLRGPILGLNQTGPCIGILFMSSLALILPPEYLSLVHISTHAVLLLLLFTVPMSPQWLLRQDRQEEGKESLMKIRGHNYCGLELEIDEINNVVNQKLDYVGQSSFLQCFTERSFVLPLLILSVIFIVIANAGMSTITFFGPSIFEKFNFGKSNKIMNVLPWIGFSFGYAVSSPIMGKVKRRPQFVICSFLMGIAMSSFAICLQIIGDGEASLLQQIWLISSLEFAAVVYGAGVGVVPYTLIGEVFTPENKTKGACLVQSVRF